MQNIKPPCQNQRPGRTVRLLSSSGKVGVQSRRQGKILWSRMSPVSIAGERKLLEKFDNFPDP